ncbi:hypothetical protein ABPG72_013264 [Tetrahymena utriculariae]
MQTSQRTSNSICQPQSKENVLNFLWLDKTTDNSIVIEKICERNLCSAEEAQLQLKEYHKFLYCLGKEFRLNELLQDQMLLFPSAIVSRIWRMHQLFTIEYPSLCRDLGFNFISFNPEKICLWSQTENQINKLKPTYEKTLELLKQEFKEELNEQIWPSNFDDMVKQNLLSFHINLTTFKAIENTVNNLNGAVNFTEMSISDIKNKIIPEIRKELHQFKETKFELVNQDSQDQRTKEVYQKMNSLVFPQEMVAHIQNEYLLTPESAQYLIMEYKKFFMIFLVNNTFSQVPSAFVDEVWHTHINFAKIYSYSCKVLAGGFINHVPATNLRENEQEIMKEEFNQTMALYEKLFGPVNEEYWQLKGEFRDDQQNFFWIDLYSLNNKSQAESQDSLYVKAQEAQDLDESISTQPISVNQEDQNNSCSKCVGDCLGRTTQNKNAKNSCDGCDGTCNANGTGPTQSNNLKNSCSGCDGTCNTNGTGTGTTQNNKLKNSCDGCDGTCNANGTGSTQNKKLKDSCNGCDGTCNANGTGNGTTQNNNQKNSCNGCDGTCNANGTGTETTQNNKLKNSCDGCDGTCNTKGKTQNQKCNTLNKSLKSIKQSLKLSQELKNSCTGCDGTCNTNGTGTGTAQNKKLKNSCEGCDGTCNSNGTGTGTTQNNKLKNSCTGCDGTCNSNGTGTGNGTIQNNKLKTSCDGCDGTCNANGTGTTQNKKLNSCNGCNGTCNANGTGNGQTQNKKLKNLCDGCDGTCNANGTGTTQNKNQKNSCNGCDGTCNTNGTDTGTTQNKKLNSCDGCDGTCNANGTGTGQTQNKKLKNSCDGCDGTCNAFGTGTTQNKKLKDSCDGCDGTCNAFGTGTTQNKKQKNSCDGCDGTCNADGTGANQNNKLKNSCDGCDGSCNANGTGTGNGSTQNKIKKNSCDGCDGTKNAKKGRCSYCDGDCFAKQTFEKKDMKWCIDCLGSSEKKQKNQLHSNKMKIQQQQKMIQLCGICFSVNEQALNTSQQNLAKLWCSVKQNYQVEQEDSQNKKTDILELVQGMNKVIVQ